jgi:uncharacterized protein (AIM24 family)
MAEFSTREVEGMRQIKVELNNETIRAQRGALSNMRGDIELTPRLPGFSDLYRWIFTRESRIRPHYSGSGTILLQPSMSGYHIFDVEEKERWILEPGIYWASEGSVELGFRREPFWASLWAGDGLFNWKTTVEGKGRVALNAPGPVEEIEVNDSDLQVQGRLVLGRTAGLKFSSRKSARFPRNYISGQQRLRVFSGTGKVLVSWTPYWNQYMYERMTGEQIERTLFE